MEPKHFHEKLDKERLTAALAEAERETHGKVYVYVSHRPVEDALAAGQRRFEELGLRHAHPHRATVLIYLAPRTHKFAIIGDAAIHERCGDAFWAGLAEGLSRDLKSGDVTAALINTIGVLKRAFLKHFAR